MLGGWPPPPGGVVGTRPHPPTAHRDSPVSWIALGGLSIFTARRAFYLRNHSRVCGARHGRSTCIPARAKLVAPIFGSGSVDVLEMWLAVVDRWAQLRRQRGVLPATVAQQTRQ
jgi:hypothetical protein